MSELIEFRKFHEKLYSKQDERINYIKKGFRPAKVRAYLIYNILRNINCATIVDVGCGEGFFLTLLSSNFETLVGIDFSLPSLKKFKRMIGKKKYENINVVLADAHAIPLRNGTFDIVMCVETLEHIYDPEKGLKELRRIAKGRILVTIPCCSYKLKLKNEKVKIGTNIHNYLSSLYDATKTTHINSFSEPYFLKIAYRLSMKKEKAVRYGFISFVFHFLEKITNLQINPKIEYFLIKTDLLFGKIPLYRHSLLLGNTEYLTIMKV